MRQHKPRLGGRQAQSSGSLLLLATENSLSCKRALTPTAGAGQSPPISSEGSCHALCPVLSPREPCGAIAANSSGSAASTCSSLATWWSIPCACSDTTPLTGLKEPAKKDCARPRTQESSCVRCLTGLGALCVAFSTLQKPGWVNSLLNILFPDTLRTGLTATLFSHHKSLNKVRNLD